MAYAQRQQKIFRLIRCSVGFDDNILREILEEICETIVAVTTQIIRQIVL